jgi:hypothetical protein
VSGREPLPVLEPSDATVVAVTIVVPSGPTVFVVVVSGIDEVVSTATDVLVVSGAVVLVVCASTVVDVVGASVVVVVGASVVVVVGASVVVVVGASVVVVVGAAVVLVVCSAMVVDVVVVGASVVVVVVGATVVVVVGAHVVDVVVDVVVVVPPLHTCVRLKVEPSCPPSICAVALSKVSVSGTFTTANLSFAATVPATAPAVWNVAMMLTNASPCEAGSTNTQPVPCPQSFGKPADVVGTCPGLMVAGVDAPASAVDMASAAAAKNPTIATPATTRARRRAVRCCICGDLPALAVNALRK